MNALFFALNYLLLRTERGTLAAKRDVLPVVILSILVGAPFLIFPDAAFFSKDGFLDHIRALASGLTGFYVAALVATATFTMSGKESALDVPIETGKILIWDREAGDSGDYREIKRIDDAEAFGVAIDLDRGGIAHARSMAESQEASTGGDASWCPEDRVNLSKRSWRATQARADDFAQDEGSSRRHQARHGASRFG